MSVVVVATVVPLPEHRDEVVRVFTETIARVHAEDAGCELYALHEGRDRLVMIEKWADKDALKAHGRGPAMAVAVSGLDGKLTGPMDVQVLSALPAGTPAQGTL